MRQAYHGKGNLGPFYQLIKVISERRLGVCHVPVIEICRVKQGKFQTFFPKVLPHLKKCLFLKHQVLIVKVNICIGHISIKGINLFF